MPCGLDSSFGGFAHQVFELCEDLLDGVKVGRVWWQKQEPCTGGSDRLADGFALVTAEIVEDDDIAWLEGRYENLLDIGLEAFTVDRPVEDARCIDTVVSQSGNKRHCFPMTMRNFGIEPLAARTPAAQGRHVGLGPGLVDKDETGRIDLSLIFFPAFSMSRDLGPVLFAWQHGFF